MTLDDLIRDWEKIGVHDDFGHTRPLKEAYDECLGRLGKPGTIFEDCAYFAKNTPCGRSIDLFMVGEGDVCECVFASGPGGFSSFQAGRFVYLSS